MEQITESEMLRRAAAYCSTAEHCIQDVQKKIKAAGLSQEEGERIIARLLQEKFIDEHRFARYFVNDKLRFNKWGRIKIAYELQKRNIPAPIRSEGKDERDIYIKLLRFAAGRGFESRETSRCLKQLFNGNDYEEDF